MNKKELIDKLKKELIDQPLHWMTTFIPCLLILWQPLWFSWLVVLFPLSREYYQHHRKVIVWNMDMWFAYAGIPSAYILYFILKHFNIIGV